MAELAKRADGSEDLDIPEKGGDIALILHRTQDILDLIRALIQLLMPKEGGREGPSLEELISALMAQGRDTLLILHALREDVNTLLDRTASEPDDLGGRRPNGRTHS